MPPESHPPVFTALTSFLGWSLDRTASLPRSHRFTFGQRLDSLTLDAVEIVVEALYSPRHLKAPLLHRLNLILEKLRVLWRLIAERGWISQRQLLYAAQSLDEIGRMTGGWLKSLDRSRGPGGP